MRGDSSVGGALASGRHRPLLRAAVMEGDAALRAWAEWRGREDIDRVDAASYRLLPQLYVNLAGLSVEAPHMRRLAEIHRHYVRENRLLFERAGEVLAALHDQDIPTLVLKGPALAVLHYGNVGARPMTDVDVLVRRRDTRRAIAILTQTGLVPSRPPERELGIGHALHFVPPGGHGVDLHWYELGQPFRHGDSWATAVPLTLGGARTLALSPPDQLLNVCVHGAWWSPLPPIRWVADAAMILRSTPGIDWDRLVERAQSAQLTTTVAAALGHLRDVVDAPVPDRVLQALHAAPTSRLERWAHHEGLQPPPRARKSLVLLYDRFRRLHAVGDPDVPRTFTTFVTRARGVEHLWQLPSHALARRLEHRRLRRVPSTILPSGRRVPL